MRLGLCRSFVEKDRIGVGPLYVFSISRGAPPRLYSTPINLRKAASRLRETGMTLFTGGSSRRR